MNTELLITADGSHTLFVPLLNECYHSTNGAKQESQHIFIDAGLKQCLKQEICVLEIGFGTGLNAFLTMVEAHKSKKTVHYTTLEYFPVEIEKALQLNFKDGYSPELKNAFIRLHSSEWNCKTQILPYFCLDKLHVDFTQYPLTEKYDVVFFDAFSPEKQAEMWTDKQFYKVFKHCNPQAILTTYCAKGSVRRAMQEAGFVVERLPGPPGKREILRAIKK
ncbi:MAG: tRNA (5-methylaminomethyl-2-thiouridine)(34)-methyltransferase MnmD [Paludibacter sp.]|nr:tRNA (5-methylaminomethyl-2-thiouridine)(34)-methyltransferase MnmD [Paludibacter sp.]